MSRSDKLIAPEKAKGHNYEVCLLTSTEYQNVANTHFSQQVE
jgi:hypothetical protein